MLRFFEELPTARGIRRRQFLQLGAAGLLASGSAVGAETSGPPGFGKARSVVLIFASGGQSHIDMWDPKPLAPTDIRGAFQTISTAVPGVAVCEHMPRIGKVLDRATILRSMSHEDLDHGTAAYLSLTGRYHVRRSGNPPPRPIDFPTYGAVLKRTRPTDRFPYECVHVNGPALVPFYEGPGQNGGFLGREFDPFVVGNPNQAVPVTGLDPQPGLPPVRMQSRRSLKESFDSYLSDLER
ncbi:MAG: DUF1501 domain-containing protein, partial [Pirellulaceae bacterium]|nr:DUF1501 domain-containing protein [Pirellulaceae bacterium]